MYDILSYFQNIYYFSVFNIWNNQRARKQNLLGALYTLGCACTAPSSNSIQESLRIYLYTTALATEKEREKAIGSYTGNSR